MVASPGSVQVSVISVLPAVAVSPVGCARASPTGVAMTAVAGSLFPQPVVAVHAFTARTWKVYSVSTVRLPMVYVLAFTLP